MWPLWQPNPGWQLRNGIDFLWAFLVLLKLCPSSPRREGGQIGTNQEEEE
jgi:hypothetical protein